MWRTREPADPMASDDPALATALQELRWYRRAAGRAGTANKASEVLLLLISAATTVAAALAATAWVTAVLAASTLILTGLRKSLDWHENWVAFTSCWSRLRSVIHEYQLRSPEERHDEARRVLMTTVDDIVDSETQTWATRRRQLREQVTR